MRRFRKSLSALVLSIFGVYLIHQVLPHQHHEETHHHHDPSEVAHHHHPQDPHDHPTTDHHQQEAQHYHKLGFLCRLLEHHTHSDSPPQDNLYAVTYTQKIKVKNNTNFKALVATTRDIIHLDGSLASFSVYYIPIQRSPRITGQRAPPAPYSS